MTYQYESLTDETFQQVVQALLAKSYTDLTCYPVGMPDGGRDASSGTGRRRDFLVFQIKFARNPASLKDPFKWIRDALDGERDKIERLKHRGAREFVFVTNIRGSSHLDSGLIDKVQNHLDSTISVDARCIWRDDLDRRLDGQYDIKLRYPNLLNGPDILRELWENNGDFNGKKRRNAALQAYLRDQYKRDHTIRFKQVELVNSPIFDLFVDVPIMPISSRSDEEDSPYQNAARRLYNRKKKADSNFDHESPYESLDNETRYVSSGSFRRHRMRAIGASYLLTEPDYLLDEPRIVIEGAPGQGKSTLSQYLAQIQRARILGEDSVPLLPKIHRDSPVYVPIKIELPDLALWIRGFNPWSSSEAGHGDAPTLEAALSAHIRRFSGGHDFSVSDLTDTLGSSPVLVILDALDEVADLTDRQSVVEEVEAFTERRLTSSSNLVTLVTSRPTALSNAASLSKEMFAYYTLGSISPRLAEKYARKWAKVRQVPSEDADELVATLAGKLSSPHLAELAKNTMQLTILLSLLLARGSNLPDKRTELYTEYLQLFLNREAEKSTLVRENRDLLLDIHGYLGYHLHAQAEGSNSSGRFRDDELRGLITEYLRSEGREVDLVDNLFHAVVGRVVALVPRIEGTFEFEVQPLREYFAARFLYETAPTPPAWAEKSGTKPDRLEAIAPNPYWMNVTRFYCGFYSKGELLDLAHRVCQLIDSWSVAASVYPRSLAVALLQDWVFAQSTHATQLVVKRVFDDVGIAWSVCRNSYSADENGYGVVGVKIPPKAGSDEVAKIAWEQLSAEPISDRTGVLCYLLRRHASRDNLIKWLLAEFDNANPQERRQWAQVALHLRIHPSLEVSKLVDVLDLDEGGQPAADRVQLSFPPSDWIYSLSDSDIFKYVGYALELPGRPWYSAAYGNELERFLEVTHPILWIHQFELGRTRENPSREVRPKSNVSRMLGKASNSIYENYKGEINTSLAPWEAACRALEEMFGRTWTSVLLSIAAASIRSQSERAGGVKSLFEEQHSLPKRIRFARRKAAHSDWWQKEASLIDDNKDAGVFLAACIVWASATTISEIADTIDDVASSLPREDLETVISIAEECVPGRPKVDNIRVCEMEQTLCRASSGTVQLLMRRASVSDSAKLALAYLTPRIDDPYVVTDCVSGVMSALSSGYVDRCQAMRLLRAAGTASDIRIGKRIRISPPGKPGRLDPEMAERIVKEYNNVPLAVLVAAIESAPLQVRKNKSVLSIVEAEGWFEPDRHLGY